MENNVFMYCLILKTTPYMKMHGLAYESRQVIWSCFINILVKLFMLISKIREKTRRKHTVTLQEPAFQKWSHIKGGALLLVSSGSQSPAWGSVGQLGEVKVNPLSVPASRGSTWKIIKTAVLHIRMIRICLDIASALNWTEILVTPTWGFVWHHNFTTWSRRYVWLCMTRILSWLISRRLSRVGF